MNALSGPAYDITTNGWDIVASPRHADVITVTGPMSEAMREPAVKTVDAAARPCVIVAVGDCAAGTGCWSEGGSGAGTELNADVIVYGCPPSPEAIKDGLARAAAMLDRR